MVHEKGLEDCQKNYLLTKSVEIIGSEWHLVFFVSRRSVHLFLTAILEIPMSSKSSSIGIPGSIFGERANITAWEIK